MNKALKIFYGSVVFCLIIGSQSLNLSTVRAIGVNGLNQKVAIATTVGWKMLQGQWYFYNDGVVVKNTWKQDSLLKWYYLGADGVMVKNYWAKDSIGRYYYLGLTGEMLVNTWVTTDVKQYYVTSDGSKAVNTVINRWVVGVDGAWNGQSQLAAQLFIDSPQSPASINYNSDLSILGRSLNKYGNKEIDIYCDTILIGKATMVNQQYNYLIKASKISTGNHTITVQAIGKDQSIEGKQISVNIFKLQPRISIDVPAANAVTRDSVNINGWALNNSGIASASILVDGKYINYATKGLVRNDVNNIYPHYVDGVKCGYSYTLNTSNLTIGSHTLIVKALGNDGTVCQSTVNIQNTKLQPRMSIDVPPANAVISDSVDIIGWAINNSKIANVTIYVDGKYINNATKGMVRNDVNNVYPDYLDGINSGYRYTLDTSNFTIGPHGIIVKALGIDGTVCQSSVKILKGNNGKMQASNMLAIFTADYEGYRATPYTGVDIQNRTIGYGHVITSGETYSYLSQASALALLKQDLQVHVAKVNVFTTGVNISQQQFDALVDFAYNCGDTALMQSTLLRNIKSGASMDLINAQFLAWVHCNGIAYTGLYRRRTDDWNMFAYGYYTRSYISAPAGYK